MASAAGKAEKHRGEVMRVIYPPIAQSLDLNECVDGLKVIMDRLARDHATLAVSLCPDPLPIVADQLATENEIVRLFDRARQMVPKPEGAITIKTSRVTVDAATPQEFAAGSLPPHGDYCSLEVAFTGFPRSLSVAWPYAGG